MLISQINVSSEHNAYPLYIGENLLSDSALIARHLAGQQLLIVSHKAIARHYLATLKEKLNTIQCDTVLLPAGEHYKKFSSIEKIIETLITKQHHRATTLVALGGGVIGDITGFAAACYQRGVSYIQVPTSLLSQVDSSVGGKTGINYQGYKNIVGAFYPPQCVIIDINTLRTLPKREFYAGLAEVVKIALLADEAFFSWLENHLDRLLVLDRNAVTYAIATACKIKADIVSQDEREKFDIRKHLNLGHTFAHAIEAVTQEYRHGEAVALGLIMAAQLSEKLGDFSAENVQRIIQLIRRAQLPITFNKSLDITALLNAMSMDKKNITHHPQFVLLHKIGKSYLENNVSTASLIEILSRAGCCK